MVVAPALVRDEVERRAGPGEHLAGLVPYDLNRAATQYLTLTSTRPTTSLCSSETEIIVSSLTIY